MFQLLDGIYGADDLMVLDLRRTDSLSNTEGSAAYSQHKIIIDMHCIVSKKTTD